MLSYPTPQLTISLQSWTRAMVIRPRSARAAALPDGPEPQAGAAPGRGGVRPRPATRRRGPDGLLPDAGGRGGGEPGRARPADCRGGRELAAVADAAGGPQRAAAR